jgi:hypothetical protein
MFRVPGTINSKAKNLGKKDPSVKIVYRNYNLMIKSHTESFTGSSKPTNSFLNDFHAYLVQEEIEDRLMSSHRRQIAELAGDNSIKSQTTTNRIGWIDKLLQTGVEDNRKNLLFWVLAPYLITIRGLDYNIACNILYAWLDKCEYARRLEPDKHAFWNRIEYSLNAAQKQERRPIKFETFKDYYPDVYKSLKLDGGDA